MGALLEAPALSSDRAGELAIPLGEILPPPSSVSARFAVVLFHHSRGAAVAYGYPLGYGARSARANEGGRNGVYSAHGDQRGRDSTNRCRAGAPRPGFVVRRSLVDHGGTRCCRDRYEYTEGWSWLPLSRLSWSSGFDDLLSSRQLCRGNGDCEEGALASCWSIGIPWKCQPHWFLASHQPK